LSNVKRLGRWFPRLVPTPPDQHRAWVFAVVLDTHSQELSDDLLRTTLLVTNDGRELKPSAWKGAAAGSHHREGTLEFVAPSPVPRTFVLRMQRPGEGEGRVFKFAP
jgi:hypothetical protein